MSDDGHVIDRVERAVDAPAFELAATMGGAFGPAFLPVQVADADVLEVVGSRFTDPGPDWVEFRLLRDGQVIATRRKLGY